MNELKPEDVMKALEMCIDGICDDCPYADNNFCRDDMMRTALALLREKDALLEQWDAKCNDYEIALLEKDAEIERLKAYTDHFKMTIKDRR